MFRKNTQRRPHKVQNNPIQVINIDASENELKISRLNIYWYITYTVKIVLSSSFLKNSNKIIINKYKIESGSLLDTLWLVWRALSAHILTFWQNVHLNTTDQWRSTSPLVRFMKRWLLVGRRWRKKTTDTPGVKYLQTPRKILVCDCDTHWLTQ